MHSLFEFELQDWKMYNFKIEETQKYPSTPPHNVHTYILSSFPRSGPNFNKGKESAY